MKKTNRANPLSSAVKILILFFSVSVHHVSADELVSLDDPAPSASGAPALESLDGTAAVETTPSSGGDAAVNLDDGKSEDSFNPYTFSRNPLWGLLPVFGLILLGLHLLPVPKRKPKNKIDQAKRFFRGISGEGTQTGVKAPIKAAGTRADRAPIEDDKTPIPQATDTQGDKN